MAVIESPLQRPLRGASRRGASSPPEHAPQLGRTSLGPPLLLAGTMSISAGVVHAAVIGVHGDDRQMVNLFTVAAVLQVASGLAALLRPGRATAAFVVTVNVTCVVGWAISRTVGVGFIAGMAGGETVGLTDGLCALLGSLAAMAGGVVLVGRRRSSQFPAMGAAILPVAVLAGLLTVPALTASASHGTAAGGHAHATPVPGAVVPVAKPFDPTRVVDLSGTEGVTRKQQAWAESMVERTVDRLPQFADATVAEAAGYRSIGDAGTGHEHLIKWDSINDSTFFDPDQPESLVYRTSSGGRVLEAAMFMLPSAMSLETVPNDGGALIQFHIHDNLCFTSGDAPRVIGLTDGAGNCSQGEKFPPSPMFHVWIKPNPCGPFAALEGVGAGQVRAGDTKACDTAHGSSTTF